MGEDDQNPNTLSYFSLTKLGFLKSSLKRSKNTGGWGQGRLEKILIGFSKKIFDWNIFSIVFQGINFVLSIPFVMTMTKVLLKKAG